MYDAGGENKNDVEVVKEIEQSEMKELVKSLSEKFEENAPSEMKALDLFVSKKIEDIPEKLEASKDRQGSIVDGSSSQGKLPVETMQQSESFAAPMKLDDAASTLC